MWPKNFSIAVLSVCQCKYLKTYQLGSNKDLAVPVSQQGFITAVLCELNIMPLMEAMIRSRLEYDAENHPSVVLLLLKVSYFLAFKLFIENSYVIRDIKCFTK